MGEVITSQRSQRLCGMPMEYSKALRDPQTPAALAFRGTLKVMEE